MTPNRVSPQSGLNVMSRHENIGCTLIYSYNLFILYRTPNIKSCLRHSPPCHAPHLACSPPRPDPSLPPLRSPSPFEEATTKKIGLFLVHHDLHGKLTSRALLDHYSKPRNVGSMSKTDTDVGTGLVGAPACGDVMKLQIRVDPNSNTISDVKFKTFGCGSAIASSSYLTELVRGMSLEDAGKIRNTEIARELCLPPVKCEWSHG